MLELSVAAFVTLFVIIDPIGLAPLFVALTQGMSAAQRRAIAARACLIGFALLVIFGLAGEIILELVGISMPAFRISGGLLLFLTAVEMLFEKRTERREKTAEGEHPNDPSVFPLAVPLIAGPGAMTTMILLIGQNPGDTASQLVIFAVMAAVIVSAFLLFLLASPLERLLGQTGINVITRLLGMLLAALSVQFVLDGLRDFGMVGS